jgi:signal transduction histidine kinase/HPt (histidine-containing phosphotransfer) domain-containing protein
MSAETKETRDARPAKPAGGGNRASTVTRGINRASLRAMTTLGVFGLAALLFLVGAFGYWRMAAAVADLERAQYGELATDVRGRVEHLVSRDRSRLKEAAFSDELYALVERGAAPPDSFIHPPFTELFPRLYGDQFVGIYDLAGKRLYGWTEGQHPIEQLVVTNPLLRILDNREPAAGLFRANDELYWVAGVPILPTNYADAAQPIRGYLVVAQTFAGRALAGLIADRPVELSLKPMAPRKTPFRSEVTSTANGDSALVRFALSDVFAQQNTLGELVTSRAEFRAVERSYHWAALAGIVLLAGLAALGWWAAQRWVVEPAARMAQALQPVHQGQIPPMVGSPLPANEWTAMTASVNRLVANVRAGQERLDRFLGAVRDGAWEQDLNTGEWSLSSRFRELLGYSEAELPATLAAFEQLIHPDDREYVLVTLQASSGSGRPIDLEARLRRQPGEYAVYRLTATVQTDHNGAPIRFTGKLVDQAAERTANLAVASAVEATVQSKKAIGRLLGRIGEELAAHEPDRGTAVSTLGDAMAGSLGRSTAPFDLHQLIQEVAARSPVAAQVAVVPGVPNLVSGDADRIRRILTELVSNAARATQDQRIGIRVERGEGAPAGYWRITVSDHGAALTSRDQHRLVGPLTTGEIPPDGAPGIGLPLVHELVRAEGGKAGAEFPAEGGARVWFELSLPAVEQEQRAAATPDFGGDTTPAFWTASEDDATFEPSDRPSDARISAPRERVSNPRFELVADETVVIDLDGDEPIQRRAGPATPAIVAQLKAGGHSGNLAGQMATIFLKDAPIRLAELKGAVRAGERTTAGGIAISLKSMANLIGAATLAERCTALERAATESELGRAGELTREIEQELDRIKPMLERFAGRSGAPAPVVEPAIDGETLEQIRASLSGDGIGLGSQLVSLFLAEAPGKVAGIESAARAGDHATVAGAAADLKGMCSLVGAGPLGAACDRLRSAPAGDGAVALAALRTEFARVQQVLEELLGARTGA